MCDKSSHNRHYEPFRWFFCVLRIGREFKQKSAPEWNQTNIASKQIHTLGHAHIHQLWQQRALRRLLLLLLSFAHNRTLWWYTSSCLFPHRSSLCAAWMYQHQCVGCVFVRFLSSEWEPNSKAKTMNWLKNHYSWAKLVYKVRRYGMVRMGMKAVEVPIDQRLYMFCFVSQRYCAVSLHRASFV